MPPPADRPSHSAGHDPLTSDERYEEVRVQVQAERGFHVHLAVYLTVNTFLLILNALTRNGAGSDGAWWFYWPLLGWGVGLVLHGVGVFLPRLRLGEGWERRQIAERLGRDPGGRAGGPA